MRPQHVKYKTYRQVPETLKNRVLKMADGGFSVRRIAEETNLLHGTVTRLARGHLKSVGGMRLNMTESQKKRVVKLYCSGKTMTAVAKQLNISHKTVSLIVHRAGVWKSPSSKSRWAARNEIYPVMPGLPPKKRYRFVFDDGKPNIEAQRNYDELWRLKKRAWMKETEKMFDNEPIAEREED